MTTVRPEFERRFESPPASTDCQRTAFRRRCVVAGVAGLAAGGGFAVGVISPVALYCLALLGAVCLSLRRLFRWRVRRRWKVVVLAGCLAAVALTVGLRTHFRYRTAEVMRVPVREYTNREYAEDPANRGAHHGQYNGRALVLTQRDATHFDFVFEPRHGHVAKVAVRDVDVGLMTPCLPEWARDDGGLRRIALTDRQWNRQQVRFDATSSHVEVTGGDGYEKQHLFSVELAKNCLNAGLWELQLFVKEGNEKALYYQGWFTFPLGHYKSVFERNTGLPYRDHWYYLEHWFDPAGTPVPLDKLRRVISEREPPTTFDRAESVMASGEQLRKRRTTIAENVVRWGDFYDGRSVQFATFIPPGRYSVGHPRANEYERMRRFEKAILRQVVGPASAEPLHELELVFRGGEGQDVCRFVVGGFDLHALPQLPVSEYPKGMYMPMGIGVPPFFQSYEDLQRQPPDKSPYLSVLLDAHERWIDHHRFGIDGPVLHRDERDPDLLHVYLLSYERHCLIGHFVVSTQAP